MAEAVSAREALPRYLDNPKLKREAKQIHTYLGDPAFGQSPVQCRLEHLGLVVCVVFGMVDAQVVSQFGHRNILRLVHGDARVLKGVLKLGSRLVSAVDELKGAAEPLATETLQGAILLGILQGFPGTNIR